MFSEESLDRLKDPAIRRLVVGLSGGVDSVSLLHALAAARPTAEICALHINHGLQALAGEFEACCRQNCAALDIPLAVQAVEVQTSGSLETNARNARYAAFSDFLESGDMLLLAHNADDQVETALFRLFRGSRLPGLQGMPQERALGDALLYRPLLDVTRADIESYAREAGLSWVEDPSNLDTSHDRNWLRQVLIPTMQARWPDITEILLAGVSRAQLQRESNLQRAQATLANLRTAPDALDLGLLRALKETDRLHVVEVIDAWMLSLQQPLLTQGAMNELLDRALTQTSAVISAGDIELRQHDGGLYLIKQLPPIEASASCPAFFEGNEHFEGAVVTNTVIKGRGLRAGDGYQFSRRKGGETIRQTHTRKVKKCYQALQVPSWLRDRMPLITLDGEVVATPGIPAWDVPMLIADGFEAGDDEAGFEVSLAFDDRRNPNLH